MGGGQRAKQIASAMQTAYANRTQASLNALSELLPLTASWYQQQRRGQESGAFRRSPALFTNHREV